jgi:predicted Zn-dependent protease
MLERIDIDRIRRTLKDRGFEAWEIYAESRTLTRMTAEDRLIASRSATTTGLSVRVSSAEGHRQFSTYRLDTEGVLAALGEGEPSARPAPIAPPSPLEAMGARSQRLNQLIRSTWPDSEGHRLYQLCFDSEIRAFERVGEDGQTSRGSEEWAGATAEWGIERDGKLIAAREELWAAGIDSFLDIWHERNPFRARTERLLRQANPWPAPAGDIPLYWSQAAVARLAHLFLRGFEGDLVLENRSFLIELPLPLPLPFSLFETEEQGGPSVDHEGAPRKALALFRDGQPRALACNRRVAEQLSVPSTGHCRRQSFLHPPQVGLWRPAVLGNERVTSPLSQLTWGVGIGDFAVESFDPATGDVTLELTDARLIHQGELGEAIERLRWPTNLMKLLGSFTLMSEATDTFGFPILKKGSRWVTEVSAPSALSPSVSLPGAVPPSHYW